MSRKPLKNVSASIRQRLLNLARERGEAAEWTYRTYGRERLLYRLMNSEHADRFVLKGATLFSIWSTDLYRSTRDVDLLGRMPNDVAALENIFREVCNIEVEDDGLQFDTDSVKAARIIEDGEYEGVRTALRATLGEAQLFLQVDIGFGDAVVPDPEIAELPPLLDDLPPVRMRAYPKAAVIAEKFHILVSMGMVNSRMKDFYDLYTIARRCEFDGEQLCDSIRATFGTRRTPVPDSPPVALSQEFADNDAQWKAFLNRQGLQDDNLTLTEVIDALISFLMPPAQAVAQGNKFRAEWNPGGPWLDQGE